MERVYRRVASLLAVSDSAAIQFAGRQLALLRGVRWGDSALRVAIPAEVSQSWHPALAGRPWPATADFTDLSPVSGPSRVRAKLSLTGTMRRDQSARESAPWTFTPTACRWREGPEAAPSSMDLELGQLMSTPSDALAGQEAELIAHLHDHHGEVVDRLSRLVPALQLHGALRVLIWRMESDGLTLRVDNGSGSRQVFLAWPEAVTTDQVSSSLAALLAAVRACPRTWT